jgi:integrase
MHVKITVIIACYGLLRLSELDSLQFENFTFEPSAIWIKIQRKKQSGTRKPAVFVIDNPICIEIVTSYLQFFNVDQRKGRFLRYFQDGKGTERNIGKHKVAEYPKKVAEYLQLSPEGYTGHRWRRTTATILSETDISLMQFKNAGGWHSDKVCQDYVEESKREKLQISARISLCEESSTESRKRSRAEEVQPPNPTTIHVDMSNCSGHCSFQYFTPSHIVSYEKVSNSN